MYVRVQRVRVPLHSPQGGGPVFSTLVLMECKLLERDSDKASSRPQLRGSSNDFERGLWPGMGEQMAKFRRIFLPVSSVLQGA